MANYVTDDGICLRVTDFSETSQVVGVLTRRHGLVPMIAKGSKRESKKNSMSGPLDLLTLGEVVFVPAKGAAELSVLAGWELRDHRTGLRKDLAGLNAAMLCAEVTLMLAHPHDPHEALYGELEATLELLGKAPPPERMRAAVSYVKAALEEAGYGPALEACVVCGKAISTAGTVRFSSRAGGVACAACEVPGGKAMEVGAGIIVALARLKSPRELLAARPEKAADAGALATAMEVLLSQVEAVTGKPVRTRYLLSSVFGN